MKKLLIIDDEQDYLNSLAVALRKKFEVVLATNYYSALEELQKGVDIALIDIRRSKNDDPNIIGFNILEWIKMNKLKISCFAVSAYRESSYEEKALILGTKHFLRNQLTYLI